jgi:hypothetical protein
VRQELRFGHLFGSHEVLISDTVFFSAKLNEFCQTAISNVKQKCRGRNDLVAVVTLVRDILIISQFHVIHVLALIDNYIRKHPQNARYYYI